MKHKAETLMLNTESLQITYQKTINLIENHEAQIANHKEEGMYHLLILFYWI